MQVSVRTVLNSCSLGHPDQVDSRHTSALDQTLHVGLLQMNLYWGLRSNKNTFFWNPKAKDYFADSFWRISESKSVAKCGKNRVMFREKLQNGLSMRVDQWFSAGNSFAPSEHFWVVMPSCSCLGRCTQGCCCLSYSAQNSPLSKELSASVVPQWRYPGLD